MNFANFLEKNSNHSITLNGVGGSTLIITIFTVFKKNPAEDFLNAYIL
jgi:hypothetical protein